MKLSLSQLKLTSFKAVCGTQAIDFTPLTAFIGNNGSGKSSIIEGLEFVRNMVLEGLDKALMPWHGLEYVTNQGIEDLKKNEKALERGRTPDLATSSGFDCRTRHPDGYAFRFSFGVCADSPAFNRVRIQDYRVSERGGRHLEAPKFVERDRIVDPRLMDTVRQWQFLRLQPGNMTEPRPPQRFAGQVRLQTDGGNIAEYLISIRDKDPRAFEGIIDTLRFVLPYAKSVQPEITSELDRKVYLMLREKNVLAQLPSWLFSTGTLRVLALLSVLRDPDPPKVILIEEIENGLDPRTIHLLVEEMRSFINAGKGQIVLTTHSPFLLDLLTLSQLVVVDRDADNHPHFKRPADNEELHRWAERFTPGKLYTMGNLSRGAK